MMHFREVPGFPAPGYRPEGQWLVNFRRWHPFIMLVFVLSIQNGFLPGWYSVVASTLLISFSVFTLFVVWYLAFLLLAIKHFLSDAGAIKRSHIFEIILPVILTFVLLNGQWLWTFVFYGFSLCNAVGLMIFFEKVRRKAKC